MSEPTRYMNCWYCKSRFPLRESREHAAACRIRQQSIPELPKIAVPAFKADWLNDSIRFEIDVSSVQREMARTLREQEDNVAEPVVVEWLRGRGFSVEKCDGGCNQVDGPDEECSLHGRPVSEVWDALAQRTKDLEAEQAQVAEATALLREFVDDDPCQLDHHGGCQTHGFLEPEPGERCHVERAREFLCNCSGYSEHRGGWHFEMMLEPEPDCPIHGEGVADV